MSRSVTYFTSAVLAAAALLLLLVLPPAPRRVTPSAPPDPLVIKGALHVHTVRSDGGGTVDDVAAAAAAAGLAFVVLADHGDGRAIEPPSYRAGVLVLDAAEISTEQGHVIGPGARRAEYPLGGEARDVVEDIHRLGGLAIAAHPASPKEALAWKAWDVPFNGLEWLNADSEWRDEGTAGLLRLSLGYWLRPAAAVARTFDRPVAVLQHADAEGARRPIVLVAGHDAHARIGKGSEDGGSGLSLPLPSYRAVFETFAVRIVLDARLTGDAAADAAAVLSALRHGRVFTAIDALATPGRFAFSIRSGGAQAAPGDRIIPGGPLEIQVDADAPDAARIVVLAGGREIASGPAPRLRSHVPAVPGAFRVEVRLADAPGTPPVPWIVSSPIFVGLPSVPPPEPEPATTIVTPLSTRDVRGAWLIEHSPDSLGALEVPNDDDGSVQLTYELGKERGRSPYVAAVLPVDVPRVLMFELRLRADRPTRVSLQLRSPTGGPDGRRWRRSIYLDVEDRTIRVPLSAFRAVPPDSGPPDPQTINSLLLVVDTVNAEPGSRGTVTVGEVKAGE